MARTTQLCEKKFKLLFSPGKRELIESNFYNKYLIQGFNYSLPETKALYLNDVYQLAKRCKIFGVQIIGVETHVESNYPFTVKVFEDFTGNIYRHEWIDRCIDELKKESIIRDLLIYINIPDDVLDILIQTFQLTQ